MGSNMQDPHNRSSTPEEKKGTVFPPSKKLDSPPSNGTVHTSLRSILPLPPPKNTASMHSSASKSMLPSSSLPKFTSPVPVSRANDKDHISHKSSPNAVPDTLVKLMDYGDDDDDDTEENENEPFKSNPDRIAAAKPFWAA